MAIRFSFAEVESRLYAIHGDKYKFLPDGYADTTGWIKYICKEHGLKRSRVNDMLNRHGCIECGKVKALEAKHSRASEHLAKLKEIHPNYEFPNYEANFKSVIDKCEVICPNHGTFFASTHHLKKGKGCRKCGIERVASARRWTKENLLDKLKAHIPNSIYTYHVETFTGYSEKMKITCPVHGDFWQTVTNHVQGKGCKKCSSYANSQKAKVSSGELLQRCRDIHGGRDDYQEEITGVAKLWTITCKKHGNFEQLGYVHLRGAQCPTCAGIGSMGQTQMFEFVKSFCPDAIMNYRFSSNSRQQIDVYVPSLKMGFEYHGLYWHSSANKPDNYHLEKQTMAKEAGIELYQIFADEWESPAAKKFIARKLLPSEGIYARLCSISEIDSSTAKEFHEQNHIQGYKLGGCSFGLIYMGELVALMTFSSVRSVRGIEAKEGHYELARFSTSKRVIGGASKLFKFIVKELKATNVISYSDNRLFTGDVYPKLGFVKSHVTAPSYTYCAPNNQKRLHKSQFRHANLPKILGDAYNPKLSERANCEANAYYQVYDCGLTKWVWQAQ